MRSEARCEAREARPDEVRDCSNETREWANTCGREVNDYRLYISRVLMVT